MMRTPIRSKDEGFHELTEQLGYTVTISWEPGKVGGLWTVARWRIDLDHPDRVRWFATSGSVRELKAMAVEYMLEEGR